MAMEYITAHGFEFIVGKYDFGFDDLEKGASLIQDRLRDLPKNLVASLHAHSDNYNNDIPYHKVMSAAPDGKFEGIEGNILYCIAWEAAKKIIYDNGWDEEVMERTGFDPGFEITGELK